MNSLNRSNCRVIRWLCIWALFAVGCAEDGQDNPAPVEDAATIEDLSVEPSDMGSDSSVVSDALIVDSEGLPDAEPNDAQTPDAGPLACDPPLTLSPELIPVAPFDLVILEGEGGTGNWRYEFVDNASGAILNELTGAYLAGPVQGTTDVVRVTDTECLGEAQARINVVLPVTLSPQIVEVGQTGTIDFEVSGGSGEFVFELVENGSGAMVTDEGQYTSGAETGIDVLRVSDTATDLDALATITVVENPVLTATPQRLYMPVNAMIAFEIIGGSGHLEVAGDEAVAVYDAETGHIEARGEGRTVLTFTDRFTHLSREVVVDVLLSKQAELTRAGRNFRGSRSLGPGDLNGDGFPDAILALAETSIDFFSDGGVYIYGGTENGLAAEPVQILNGDQREQRFGKDMAVGDVDGDGRVDLIVGAPLSDSSGGDRGLVYIFSGVEGGFFTDEPTQILLGQRGGDQFGLAVAACDFNGDGRVDLAVAASRYEDRNREDHLTDESGVLVYLGTDDGLEETHASSSRGGRLAEDGEFVPVQNLRWGEDIAAGDINGDGLCDLAVGAPATPFPGVTGAVYVFSGTPTVVDAEYPEPGGLVSLPNIIYAGDEEGQGSSGYARRLHIHDLDGDDRGEILVGMDAYDSPGGNNRGAVRVIRGGPLDGPVQHYTSIAEDAVTILGNNGADQLGVSFDAWLEEDGSSRLGVGSWFDESGVEGTENNVGGFLVYAVDLEGEGEPEPVSAYFGAIGGACMGDSLAALGDLDGDGITDYFTMAARDNTLGPWVGLPYFVSGAEGNFTPLDLPGIVAGKQFGRSMSIAANFGPMGETALLVSAPEDATAPALIRTGGAWIYLSDETGTAPFENIGSLTGYLGQSGSDLFGMSSAVGDFDGDGIDDIVVGASSGERPTSDLTEGLVGHDECPRDSASGTNYIYLGGQSRAESLIADFIYSGRQTNSGERAIAMADLNGDGSDDLVLGGSGSDRPQRDTGLVRVVLGRTFDAPQAPQLICDPVLTIRGQNRSEALGHAATALGDLDGDGCEDIAIGAPSRANGLVRIIFGWGGAGCPSDPTMVVLTTARPSAQFGYALAAGDLIGDDTPDLVVGAPRARNAANTRTGRFQVVDGAWIRSLPVQSPDVAELNVHDVDAAPGTIGTYGQTTEERFGDAVAAYEDIVTVGYTARRYTPETISGGVALFRLGEQPIESGVLVGETHRTGGRLGATIHINAQTGLMAVGAPAGSGIESNSGSAYVLHLDRIP